MLTGYTASAQVVIKGDVHGGGLEGQVKNLNAASGIFGNASVTINDGTVEGSVYGGGKGVVTDETTGLVEGNTTVTMKGGIVGRSIYGGGELGSVGTFTTTDSTATYTSGPNAGVSVPFPTACATGTGLSTVTVTGGSVGLRGSLMPWDDHNPDDDDRGWIFCGSRGEADSITYPRVIAMGVVNATHLEINKTETTVPLITASVYGGCENGLVLDSTFVEIKGGQIGTGLKKIDTINDVLVGDFADPYTESNWTDAINAVKNGTIETALAGSLSNTFYACDAWKYGVVDVNSPTGSKKYDVYDIYYDSLIDPNDPNSHYRPYNTDSIGSNGQSFFGNVFGGGSGYYPIAPGVWRRTAGRVNGNTRVEITGGHILTSVYGGNEISDVMGRTTIKMSGGTIGVPRSNADIQDHPVLCNLFGSGKGDQRVWANKWTNVDSTIVEFTGGTIFGSIFGGGEDGHVLGSAYVIVNGDNALIGTLGYSGFEGHVYGSGRGFSGDALTAGNVGGNTNITIESGTILGSIYGGGRNASVGPKLWNTNEPLYGQMQPDDEEGTHGHTYVTINGGVIGNDYESKLHRIDNNQGGNVFGGSMGTFSLLDGSINTMWPRMSKVKSTNITIDGENTIIKGNVFGGCKLGTVTENTSVTINNGTIWRSVYGSGYGSDNNTYVADNVVIVETPTVHDSSYLVTPRRHAGRVYGNTTVTLNGGWVKKNVYGGGDMASVGTITDEIFVHSEIDSLSIGWPVRLTYAPNTGTCTVNINGGRIGITGNDFMGPWNSSGVPYNPETGDPLTAEQINNAREINGHVFGGGKGKVGPRREMAELADYVNTEVTVNYTSSTATESNFKPGTPVSAFYSKYSEWTDFGTRGCIVSNLYGASENGHIHDNTLVTLENGLIGGSLFGGGKGTDMYTDTLWVTTDNGATHTVENASVHSVTAGKVFGNTHVIMNDGQVLGNVYGGGEYASVGKGNYLGYGEKTGSQATADSANYVLTSGKCFVTINGGTVGSATWNHNGNVFGSSKGLTFESINATPRYNYSRDFFLGYANFTNVTIGGTTGTGPTIRGSVFGGGENGHVRFNTEVTINKGEIGDEYAHIANADERAHRGNVYGAGQGIDKIASTDDYCNSAGSVTLKTKVTVNGGTIHRNIYGGGSLASVGPPPVKTYNPGPSLNEVIIKGGTIGEVVTTVNEGVTTYNNYGGDIFGAGRGIIDEHAPFASFATSHNTKVTLDTLRNGNTVIDQAFVIGNVYGGGELGQVKHTTQVDVKAGMVGTIGYTWKHDTDHAEKVDSVYHKTGGSVFGGGRGDLTDPVTNREAALVTDTTHVTISGGHVQRSVYGGGEVASVGEREPHRYKYNGVWYDDYLPKQSQEHTDSTGVAMVTIKGGQIGPAPKIDATHDVKIGLNGQDGYVFGGGKGIGEDNINALDPAHPYSGKDYYAIADVNNTIVTVDMEMPANATDTTNRIWGSTFGGAEDGHVLGSARTYYKNGLMGTTGTTTYDGNIFGGGRNFSKKNYNAGRVRVNDSIDMCGGQIYGSIFGGGRLALTGIDLYGNIIPDSLNLKQGNTFVKVSGGTVGNDALIEEWIASTMGDVYGAGKGDTIGIYGHPKASALLVSLVKNTEVLITDTIIGGVKHSPRILGSVFGGGEVACVGQFTWKIGTYSGVTNIGDIELVPGTGKTKVTVKGGTIGADKAQMRLDMVDGTGKYDLKYNDDRGHVFGGGEGWVDNPANYAIVNPSSNTPGIHNNKRLIDLMALVGETQVTIGKTDNGSAWVKGSVYGGSMNGHVVGNAKVTVSGGQIGAGYYVKNNQIVDSLYAESKFFNPVTYFGTTHTNYTDVAAADALHGCYRWDYVANNQRPFDPIALKTDTDQENHSNSKPTNGETWFGSVFGGGSGYYPYIVRNHNNTADSCVWNPDAGKVFGHTEVEITGGHILSNVYGGCQTTDVGNYVEDGTTHQLNNNSDIAQSAKAIVTISGGTVGVPETISSIQDFPYMSSVYGGGQGNFRDEFKKLNNVDSTRVVIKEVSGKPKPIVYGMVFGGSQNGHVLDSTKVIVSGGVVGITGLSGYDGCVFGGGQGTVRPNPGHPGDSLYAHAGRVGGNTRVVMTDGKVLGNLYGGGMVALTGVGVDGWFDAYTTGTTYASEHHGNAKVELSGGFVGNDFNNGRNLLKSSYASGNVYGGSRGKLDEYEQDDLGRLANSAVKISGSPTVYGSVYGGGQMANSGYWLGYEGWYATNTANTSVTIKGSPKIGTSLEFVGGDSYAHHPGDWTYYDKVRYVDYEADPFDTTYLRVLTHTRTGNVFGGGQGEVKIIDNNRVAGLEQGHCATTNVNIIMTDDDDSGDDVTGGHIMGSVFGGSEEGVIWGETEVHIGGGTIGSTGIVPDSLRYNYATHAWDTIRNNTLTYYYGSVFGGSYGKDYYSSFNITNPRPAMIDSVNVLAGRVYGNTKVEIEGGAIRGNVFGGGDMASVGYWRDSIIGDERVDIVPDSIRGITGPYKCKILGNARVTVTGNTTVIGPLDGTGLNGYVFGGGKGFSNDPDGLRKAYANVDSTFVTISGGRIYGSVLGGGSDSHVLGSTSVTVHTGANIGTKGITTYDGNIFGGGRNFQNTNHTNGRVAGNTFIDMDGGTIQGSIFGGGRLALTGVNMLGNPYVTEHVYDSVAGGKTIHGLATITVSGSSVIGNSNGNELLNGSDESVGDIFGSGKGDTKAYKDVLAGRVANTKIEVKGSPRIYGSVFGGGEMAGIGYWYTDNGKAKFYDKSGTAEVTIGATASDALEIGTDMEFWADYAYDDPDIEGDGPSYWTVYGSDGKLIHTCTGNVYGGSQGDVDTIAGSWVSMARSRRSYVTINGGIIKSRVFGGAEQGSVAGNTYVTVNGGTIGSIANYDAAESERYLFGGVYGGGYGSHNPIFNGTVTAFYHTPIVNDSTTALNAAYPGENLWTADHLAGRVYGNTRVDVLGGIIQGDVFGGASFAYIGGYGNSPSGNVQLNIGNSSQQGQSDVGTTIKGSVFGANNHSGTPYGNVRVDVYHTKHTDYDQAPVEPTGGWTHELLLANAAGTNPYTFAQEYALKEVYGGGNKASFTPNQAPQRTTEPRSTTVYVHYCENTIKDLYGGGKSADIGTSSVEANSSLQVDGGRFYRIFGGGNGSLGNPLIAANTYGTALTNIKGGVIQEVYGGNNQYGNINTIDLKFNDGGQVCTEYVDEIFAGSNESPLIGDIVADLNCGEGVRYDFYGGTHNAVTYGNITLNVYGGTTTNVYGGSKGSSGNAADIKKFPSSIPNPLPQPGQTGYNVVLDSVYRYMIAHQDLHLEGTGGNIIVNLYGGTIENLYGGCSVNGNVEGNILINVIDVENTTCPLDVTNIYGGGEGAYYKPMDTTITSPIINVVHVKETEASVTPSIPYIPGIRGNVFGGGKGNAAKVTANPQVNIGYNASHTNTFINTWKTNHSDITPRVLICGNVYGGGELAQIDGNTTVNVYQGEIGEIGYIYKHDNTTQAVYDSIYHKEYDVTNHLVGGNVYGGGKGTQTNINDGRVTGNSTVTLSGGHVYYNVYGGGEMASVGQHTVDGTTGDFLPVASTGKTTVTVTGGQVGPAPNRTSGYNIPIGLNGTDGYVFGGGKGIGDDPIFIDDDPDTPDYPYGQYYQYANVNETEVIINIPMPAAGHPEDSVNNRIWGSVFGGAEDGHVLGSNTVEYQSGYLGTMGTSSYDGNIFGGGRNYYHKNYTAGRTRGNNTVEMTGGQLLGNIYGGGRLALTGVNLNGTMQDGSNHGNTKVMVKGGIVGNGTAIETFTNFSMGNIYGGGKGYLDIENTLSNDAEKTLLLGLTKNTTIEISDTLNNNTHVYGIVLGGGEIANVGNYTLTKDSETGNITNIAVTEGTTKVKVSGGIIGGDRSQMRFDLAKPSDPTNWDSKYNDDLGYVYGGGEGWSDNPAAYPTVQESETSNMSLLDLIATVQSTEVTITNDTTVSDAVSKPWVKASVFGGSESGHVRGNTKVTIAGGQIGAGYTRDGDNNIVDVLYTDGTGSSTNQFINPCITPVTSDPGDDNTLKGTYHWQYGIDNGSGTMVYNPFDPAKIRNEAVYDHETGNTTYGYVPSDGKSWFGNVFGGGSGWFPYVTYNTTTSEYESNWNPLSGKVWGNTEVVITGGHILNNVYGANESTDVGGKATIKMSGGTVGVPRTAAQVAEQPVICYVFGGGCGDPRSIFDNETNVASTDVQITGGIIYGSVFGGAEDGHVLGNVDVKIGEGDEFTVGEAPNAITYTYPIIGSTGTSGADGNLFGGGRNFSHENNEAGRVAGNINIDMDGGVFLGSIYGGGRMGSTGVNVSGENITTDPTLHGNVTIDISGGTVGNRSQVLTHTATSIGDVFGGGKGNSASAALGRVRNTNVKISGDAKVLNNVYGGGELANVGWATTPGDAFDSEKGGLAKIEISGGQVGIEQIGTAQATIKGGYVYGGGLGLAGGKAVLPFANVDTTYVNISGTAYITSSVFGGADNGHVWRNTSIVMEGGIVGQPNTLEELTVDANEQPVSHIYTGSVIGGGRGTTPIATTPVTIYHDTTGIVFGNTSVDIKGTAKVRKAVYGGGGLSHVGTFERNTSTNEITFTSGGKCTVSVAGNAHIGPLKEDLAGYDNTQLNTFFNNLGANAGWVFGAGCGLAEEPNLTFNDSTLVTIYGSAQVTGAVFGGGENGHVKTNTRVLVSGGTIGGIPLHGTGSVSGIGDFAGINFTATTDECHEDEFGAGRRVLRGFVYGGGKGNDFVSTGVYNPHAGQVYGNSKVEITNGTIYSRVFGGGLLASVGTFTYATAPLNTDSIVGVVDGTGLAKVIVSGGTIGTDGNNNGDVLGGGRGQVGRHWEPNYTTGDQVVNLAYVGNTEVTIKGTAQVKSNVYGGAGSGHVQEDAHVIIEGGTIGIEGKGGWHSNVYGGGGGQHQYVRNSSTNPPTMHHSITSGRVYGNTKVEISGGQIMHNVYGGGAIASVGTYNIYSTTPEGLFKPGTGDTEVTITGGTIGTNGNENGMVFGSGRGQIASIGAFMDSLSYAVNTVVNIGTEGSATGPMVHGSVYGSGENGHVFKKATVNVYSGTIGCESYDPAHASYFANHGNVYGAGCGTDMYDSNGDDVRDSYNPRSGIVQGNTEVNIKGGHISHAVYGGGAMAMVGYYNVSTGGDAAEPGMWGDDIDGVVLGTGKTVVNVSGGTIGTSNAPEGVEHGNVYGGSRGPSRSTENGFTNMALTDTSYVFILDDAHVLGSVFGGGAKSWTRTARVATVSGGTVEKDVYGGGQNGIASNTPFTSLKTVNVRGGHIKGNVFGSSYIAEEKTSPVGTWETGYNYWSSFVNITGGTIDHNVYGAGYGGAVNGSVCVNIGLAAVNLAPTNTIQTGSTQANVFRNAGLGNTPLGRGKLKIVGDIFGGSFQYESTGEEWNHNYDITGYSTMFIDGDGYNTTSADESVDNYMNLGGGIYGSGNYCESGAKGREIILRRYGTRNNNANNELQTATRSLTTIQRGGIVLIDSTNVNLTGIEDISGQYDFKKFGVLQVDLSLLVANGSGIVLGEPNSKSEVYMDSIRSLRSLYLEDGHISYDQLGGGATSHWQMVGIKDSNDNLYRIQVSDSTVVSALDKVKENVIIFNGTSRLWVRYNDNGTKKYGELYGFFRMRQPFPVTSLENFAEARPKLTNKNNPIEPYTAGSTWNQGDGGFLSYVSAENNFTTAGNTTWFNYPANNNDGGLPYTNTRQYPYLNVGTFIRDDNYQDMETYRVWAMPSTMAHKWYVDGRGIGTSTHGWGQDKSHEKGWGDYPDKPKLTVSGAATGGSAGGICIDQANNQSGYKFNPENDIIFVVGPINASLEADNLNQSSTYPLKLYRYPGGHVMSNGKKDTSTLANPSAIMDTLSDNHNGLAGNPGLPTELKNAGPGPNYGAMILANNTTGNFVMDNVAVNGLYVYDAVDSALYKIPESFAVEKLNVSEPLVVTTSGSTTKLKGGTTLTNGYNNTDASGHLDEDGDSTPEIYNYYVNSDYNGSSHNGGGLYVAPDIPASGDDPAVITKVKVEGLVTITGNKQKKGSGTIESNVYLPTFDKHIEITNELDASSVVGVTSPNRNKAKYYWDNTFSPVAVGVRSGATENVHNSVLDAKKAWTNNNFRDDQGWFFSNGGKDTYYLEPTPGKGNGLIGDSVVYFGWTWANVVRTQPAGYTVDGSDITISSEEGLAWLISQTTNINGATPSDFSGKTISLTNDLDLKQYVWVPIGSDSEISSPYNKKFRGTFDGQGHIIDSLFIEYIGLGDHRYERTNYGLFGDVDGGKIKRTFVVGGLIQPGSTPDVRAAGPYNIGGLVGYLEGENALVSGSEAALKVNLPNTQNVVVGGLVGKMLDGEVHSSMAMPVIVMYPTTTGFAGGLIGSVEGGNVYNSFVNAKFSVPSIEDIKLGGLLGSYANATVENCYVNMHDNEPTVNPNLDGIVKQVGSSSHIDYVYVMPGQSFNSENAGEHSKNFTAVIDADKLGYMYADNKVEGDAMFVAMNRWVTAANGSGHKYASWARPGLQEINGDLPVLLLSEFDGTKDHQGGFRSLSTYEGGPALQYGGPARDTIASSSPQLDGALTRATAGNSIFIYGDVVCAPTVPVSADKVSIYEDASILHPGSLVTAAGGSKVEYDDTYVGITFDNSKKSAVATYGVNYGLSGGTSSLNRDWHMFSTPLSSAPLGFDYKTHNVENLYTSGDYSSTGFYNNPWADQTKEFTWLRPTPDSTNVRYWMKGWNSSQSPRVPSTSPFDQTKWVDGYFPSNISNPLEFGTTCVAGTDEDGRYPYGMDFYTWTEPDYHWINFKRNGPNHWHSDGEHEHINYKPYGAVNLQYPQNVNEENLIVGRGYMASIAMQTFLQSHGTLNAGEKSIAVTKTGTSKVPGWNLVGNPYHGYIDFDLLASNNGSVLDIRNSQQFYVVYDADGFGHGGNMDAGSAFLYYAVGGSTGGEYADRYIHPHQGFYVLAKDGGGNLSFNESMLVGRDGSSFRDEEQPAYPLVNLYLSSVNGCNDVTVIELERPEWGGARKIRELRNGNGLFYAQHDNTHFAALFAVVGTERVPLWFEAKEDDIYTIKWNTANGNFQSMYLIDNKLGVHYDMLRNDTYSFEGHVGDYPSRFYIVFNVTDVDEHLGGDGFVFFDDSQWIVTGEGDLEFIDVQGQVLLRKHVNGGQSRVTVPDVAPGVYLFRLSNSNGTRVQKVIVKR